MLSAISNSLERLVDPDCHPSAREVLARLTIGTPFFIGAGALTGYLLGKSTTLILSPSIGVFAGCAFTLINTITSLSCNLLGIDLASSKRAWKVKVVADSVCTVLAALFLYARIGVALDPMSISILVPGMFLTATALVIGGYIALLGLQMSLSLVLNEARTFTQY